MTLSTVVQSDGGATRFGDIIYEKIVGMIADGNFPVNERLPSEEKLAVMFGASRPVIREALEHLRGDGLIVSRKGSGSYVRQRPDSSVLKMVPVGSLADVQRFSNFAPASRRKRPNLPRATGSRRTRSGSPPPFSISSNV